jgi:hypothetical protein
MNIVVLIATLIVDAHELVGQQPYDDGQAVRDFCVRVCVVGVGPADPEVLANPRPDPFLGDHHHHVAVWVAVTGQRPDGDEVA